MVWTRKKLHTKLKKFLKKHRKGCFYLAVCFVGAFFLLVYPQTKLTEAKVINFLSERKPPPWDRLPEGAEIDVEQTKIFKQQKMVQLKLKAKIVGVDLVRLTSWDKTQEDLKSAGGALADFWGISLISYKGETIIVGEGEAPIKLNDRVLRWHKEIKAASQKYQIEPSLIAAVIEQESGGDPEAVSYKGAGGLMQLMPATAKQMGVNPADPAQNIDGGAHYLAIQLNSFGSVQGALAAYNAGPGNVENRQWVKFPETMNYVQRVPQLKTKYDKLWVENGLDKL